MLEHESIALMPLGLAAALYIRGRDEGKRAEAALYESGRSVAPYLPCLAAASLYQRLLIPRLMPVGRPLAFSLHHTAAVYAAACRCASTDLWMLLKDSIRGESRLLPPWAWLGLAAGSLLRSIRLREVE